MDKLNKKITAGLIAAIALFGAAFSGLNSIPAFAQEGNEQMEATTATELPGSTAPEDSSTTESTTTATTEEPGGGTTTTETNATTETTTEQPATPAEQPQPEETPSIDTTGPGFFGFEQVVDFKSFTEDCVKQLVDFTGELWFNGVILGVQTPDEQQSVDAITNASDTISDQVEQELPQDVKDDLDDQAQEIIEGIQNASDNGIISIDEGTLDQLNDSANAGAIIDEETQEGVIEEVGDATGATDDVTDIIAGEVDDVFSGDQNASEAADNIATGIEDIANETASEITPGDVEGAVGDMNVTDIVDEITEIAQGNDTQSIADDIIDNAIENATESAGAETGETPAAGGNEQVQTVVAQLSEVRDKLSAIIATIGT